MDLQYLNGFDGDGMEELGKLFKKNMAKSKAPLVKTATTPKLSKKAMKKAAKSNPATPAPAGSSVSAPKKKKGFFKKVLNVVNKVNPATVLLRNGVLAAMKLNIKNVAKRLRWSYLNAQQAEAKGIDPVKFQKLVATRQKLENIFYGAGGKPDNLRKAILGGKGNKDKAVSGLGILPMMDAAYMNEHIALEQLLGPDIYYSENVEGMNGFRGFGELGEPVTLATVGAAMGVIAGIVAALKQIGDVFKKKGEPGSDDFDEAKTDAAENNVNVPVNSSTTPIPSVATNPIIPNNTGAQSFEPSNSSSEYSNTDASNSMVKTAENTSPATMSKEVVTTDDISEEKPTTTTTTNANDTTPPDKESFWDKNKKWLKPVAIGLGGLTIIAIGYKLSQGSKAQNKSSPKSSGLSGVPNKKKKKRNHHRKSNHHHKKAVALL